MKIKKILYTIISLIVVVVGFWFLWNKLKKTDNSQKTADLPIVKVAASPPAIPHLISYIIQKQEFDRQNGFVLQIVGIDPTQTISALNNGTVDVAVIGVLPAVNINFQDNNSELKIFAPAINMSCPFVVTSESGITSINQLENKKVGIPTKAGATYPLMSTLFKKTDIDADNYFQLVEGQFFALPSMLDSGQVDAIAGVCDEIDNGKFATQGNKVLIGSFQNIADQAYGSGSPIILSGLAARDSWLTENNSQLSSSFTKAYYQSIDYIKNNPQVFDDKDIKSLYEMSDEDVVGAKNFMTSYQNYSFGEWNDIVRVMNLVIEDAYKFGYIKGIPATSIFYEINK